MVQQVVPCQCYCLLFYLIIINMSPHLQPIVAGQVRTNINSTYVYLCWQTHIVDIEDDYMCVLDALYVKPKYAHTCQIHLMDLKVKLYRVA